MSTITIIIIIAGALLGIVFGLSVYIRSLYEDIKDIGGSFGIDLGDIHIFHKGD